MKKLLLVTVLFLSTTGIYAVDKKDRKDDIKKVSYTAIQQFNQEFQTAKNVTWKVSDKYIRASFTLNGKQLAALYDLQGNYAGAVEYVAYEAIPVKARLQIEAKYKNYVSTSVLQVISRPNDSYGSSDIGSYWVDLSNEEKHLLVTVSPSLSVSLHKTIASETIAKN